MRFTDRWKNVGGIKMAPNIKTLLQKSALSAVLEICHIK
jgi:hypothetical protein